MSFSLSAAAQRVQDALAARGVACSVVELPASTRTAAEAARAVGCEIDQIVKSLVFRGRDTGEPLLVLTSGARRVDEARVAALVGEAIEKADADYVRQQTGFAIGGVPPVGHARSIRTIIDSYLLSRPELWAAAGTPHAVFQVTSDDLQRLAAGEIADVSG
jgi:prolyl-tRNA editing enzyme YbaK/EbsC (Cys-tRNA(Pro) deacylase)